MSGGAVVIIIDPDAAQKAQMDGFAQERQPIASPYTEAIRLIEQAELAGGTVRIIGV